MLGQAETDEIPLPLLITGVAGVAGYNAFAYFSQRFPGQVVGIRHPGNGTLQIPADPDTPLEADQVLLVLGEAHGQ